MEPQITSIVEDNNVLKFTMSNIDHSLANSLRRICLSDIPTFVFKTFPHSENKVNITINTTRLNNEIIKQRLGCIPIHINDSDFPYNEYVIELDKKNDSDNIQYVTTQDFKIKNKNTNKYLSENATRDVFPPNIITGDYIEVARLRPRLSADINGEHLQFNATIDIGTSKEDGMYNVVSTCSYGNTVDAVKANDIWNDKKKELQKMEKNDEEIEYEKKNWFMLEAKRITIPRSFDFTVETVGVYSNFNIMNKSSSIMIDKCKSFIHLLDTGKVDIVPTENSTVNNEYTVTIENEDYTLGNPIVYFLYSNYYEKKQTISYVGFRKPHPHIPKSIIRIAFHNQTDVSTVVEYLIESANNTIKTFQYIQKSFSE